MQFVIERSFAKSSKKLPKEVQLSILKFIKQVEVANEITELSNIRKLTSNKKDQQNYYRYKAGDYRFGFILENTDLIRFVVADHRKDIYKNFP